MKMSSHGTFLFSLVTRYTIFDKLKYFDGEEAYIPPLRFLRVLLVPPVTSSWSRRHHGNNVEYLKMYTV